MSKLRAILVALITFSVAALPVAGSAALALSHDAKLTAPMSDCCPHGKPCPKTTDDCGSMAGCALKCFNFSGAVVSGITVRPALAAEIELVPASLTVLRNRPRPLYLLLGSSPSKKRVTCASPCSRMPRLRASWRVPSKPEEIETMFSRAILIAAGIAAATSFATQAGAGADDYTFEAVKPEVQKGDTTLGVRLVQKSTKKSISDAVIVRSRVDMGPDGMPTMELPLAPEPSSEPGVYSFKTNLPMAGHWLLSIAAKVQGEPETVVGKITYTVTP